MVDEPSSELQARIHFGIGGTEAGLVALRAALEDLFNHVWIDVPDLRVTARHTAHQWTADFALEHMNDPAAMAEDAPQWMEQNERAAKMMSNDAMDIRIRRAMATEALQTYLDEGHPLQEGMTIPNIMDQIPLGAVEQIRKGRAVVDGELPELILGAPGRPLLQAIVPRASEVEAELELQRRERTQIAQNRAAVMADQIVADLREEMEISEDD